MAGAGVTGRDRNPWIAAKCGPRAFSRRRDANTVVSAEWSKSRARRRDGIVAAQTVLRHQKDFRGNSDDSVPGRFGRIRRDRV